jgi:uncharacterized protein (DUF1330 family)
MPKGYWIMRVTVHDQAKYDAYRAQNLEAIRRFGGRFLVRGGTFENPEGSSRARNVVIEFPSYQAAVDCYQSHIHNQAVAKRRGGADVDFIVIEGYDGAQPQGDA